MDQLEADHSAVDPPPSTPAVNSAIEAAGQLDPGLQEFYTRKFGQSIQEDIAAAASTQEVPKTAQSGRNAAVASPSAQAQVTALSNALSEYWEKHAVTHGGVATGSGRELLRSVHIQPLIARLCWRVRLDSFTVLHRSVFSHAIFKV